MIKSVLVCVSGFNSQWTKRLNVPQRETPYIRVAASYSERRKRKKKRRNLYFIELNIAYGSFRGSHVGNSHCINQFFKQYSSKK